MRPIPIPDAAVWEGAKRIVMSAPNGDLTDDTIRPVEAIDEISPTLGVRILTVMCALDPGDLEKLAVGGTVLVSFYGAMVPFEVNVIGPVAPDEATVQGDAMADVIHPDGTHDYWSTHCRHGNHEACRATELAPGVPRRPAQCKTCGALCRCPDCHGEAP